MHAGFSGVFILTVGSCASMQFRTPERSWRSTLCLLQCMSPLLGTPRHFAAAQQLGRFLSEADIELP
jgi:hypothetical protein